HAVVGDPALGVVVGADALAAVATADLQLAAGGGGGGAAFGLHPGDGGAQALHRLVAVGVLAALGLRLDHDAGRQVGDAHGRVGLVDVLAARAGGAEGVDPQVGRVDLDRLAFLLDRNDRYRRGRGVDPALRFGLGHALHAVGAGFELQARVGAFALDPRDHLAESAVFAGIGRLDLHPPALALGVAGVHAQQVAGEDRGLVAAGAGADLQVRAAVVARIARYQQRHELFLERVQAGLSRGDLLLGQVAQLGVVAHLLRRLEVGAGAGLVRHRRRQRLEPGELARQRAETVLVARHRRIGEQSFEFVAAVGQRLQLTAQGRQHRRGSGAGAAAARRPAAGRGCLAPRRRAGRRWARAAAGW